MLTWKRKSAKYADKLNSQNHSVKSDTGYYIQFIADYSSERNLSFTEVEQKFWKLSENMERFNRVSVPPFSTVATGFMAEQLGIHSERPEDLVLYLNTAPRKDSSDSRIENEGEPLMYAELENGVPVVGTNSGKVFSFLKPKIEQIYSLAVPEAGSQFRSRDIFPEAVVEIAEGRRQKWLKKELSREKIPDKPDNTVCYIDGFGNLKTSIRESELSATEGQKIRIKKGGRTFELKYAEGIFGVEEGELVLAPGSSGGEDPYLEIVLRGGSAEEQTGFDYGDSFKLET